MFLFGWTELLGIGGTKCGGIPSRIGTLRATDVIEALHCLRNSEMRLKRRESAARSVAAYKTKLLFFPARLKMVMNNVNELQICLIVNLCLTRWDTMRDLDLA